MTDEEQTRDEIEEIVKEDGPAESAQETIIEEEVKPVVKAKSKASKTENQNNETTNRTY